MMTYLDEKGQVVEYEIGAQSVKVLPTELVFNASLDKSIYSFGESARLALSVSNIGITDHYSGYLCVQFKDQAGNVLAGTSWWTPSYGNTVSGQTIYLPTTTWALEKYTAGNYRVEIGLTEYMYNDCRAELVVASQTIPFQIVPNNTLVLANSTLAIDKGIYQSYDRVLASTAVINTTKQGLIENHSLRLQVLRPDTTVFATTTQSVPQLVPLNQWPAVTPLSLKNEKPGIYKVVSQLLDSVGQVVEY